MEKPYVEFTKTRGECKECRKAINAEYRSKNRLEMNRKNNIKVKEKYHSMTMEERRAFNRKRTYGISEEDYTILLEKCQGVCPICSSTGPLVIDHNHSTGKVRGLLCNTCNTGIGKLGDTAESLQRALDYLTN